MTVTFKHLRTALLAATGCAVFAGTPAFAANADLVGLWAAGLPWGTANAVAINATGELNPNNFGANNSTQRGTGAGAYTGSQLFIIAEQDPAVNQRQAENRPMYKAEHWPDIYKYDYLHHSDPTGTYSDPQWLNMPAGLPLIGNPGFIVPGRNDNELFFIYGNRNQWRYIPTDCRPHDEGLSYDASFNGHSVGCWEGNTLVIRSKGFTDQTWLGWPGWVHSFEMEVEERLALNEDKTRLSYTRIIHDPMLIEPWNMGTNTLTRNDDPMDFLAEEYPYDNRHLLEVGGGG